MTKKFQNLTRNRKDACLFVYPNLLHNEFAIAAYFVAGTDIGKFTIKTIDDIRALNKNVHFRPACNLYNINELALLWERKIGRTLPRVTVSENDLLVAAAGLISFLRLRLFVLGSNSS